VSVFTPPDLSEIRPPLTKLNAVNPEAYLRDTLGRIAEGHPINRIGELMPWRSIAIT